MGLSLTLGLGGAGMTTLHKVGLAGLYMTLERLSVDAGLREQAAEAGLRWNLAPRSVSLHFNGGNHRSAFEWLVAHSFKLSPEGLFSLTGLERTQRFGISQRHLLYQALKGTFLQFGPHVKPDKARPKGLNYEVDGKSIFAPDVRPVGSYRHQEAPNEFLVSGGSLRESVEVAGWLYPGAAQRHVSAAKSKMEEPIDRAVCLLYAPVGAIYFLGASHLRGRKVRTVLVLPDIVDLAAYSELRLFIAERGVLEMTAAGASDAALAFALQVQAAGLSRAVGAELRVYAFGIVPFSEKQKTRTGAYTVRALNPPGLRNYHLAASLLRNRWQIARAQANRKGDITRPESAFISTPTTREIIADNIAQGRRWYHGFADWMSNKEIRQRIQFERKELNDMAVQADYPEDRERRFVEIMHEAWRRRLGQIGDRSRKERIDFNSLAAREYERQRSSLTRCKNAASLRETLTDFWSRVGALPQLKMHWQEILPLLGPAHWRTARDLALLGLASYAALPTDSDEGPKEGVSS